MNEVNMKASEAQKHNLSQVRLLFKGSPILWIGKVYSLGYEYSPITAADGCLLVIVKVKQESDSGEEFGDTEIISISEGQELEISDSTRIE